jgi:predicted small secreted protein
MKKTLVILSLRLVTLSLAGCDKMKQSGGGSGDFKSDSQKYSYALGQQFGKNIAQLEVPLDKTCVGQLDFADAIDGKEDKMDDKQIQEAMMMLQRRDEWAEIKEAPAKRTKKNRPRIL